MAAFFEMAPVPLDGTVLLYSLTIVAQEKSFESA
jgi:hypothetical protein